MTGSLQEVAQQSDRLTRTHATAAQLSSSSAYTMPLEASSPHNVLPTPDPSPAPTWRNMPNKDQLAILALSRFVDFFQMAALQTFMVHQLKSFDPELPDLLISHQAGVLQGAFTATQIITSILWGRAADYPTMGRKAVLNIGLVGTGLGCIGVGFSKTYTQAVSWRLLSGAVNGTVGSARTMVAETTPKPWHPRAFLLLPAAFNIANLIGPILAGILVEPIANLPWLFGDAGFFTAFFGNGWIRVYPFALANLLSTVLLFAEAILVHFALRETLAGKDPSSRFAPDVLQTFRAIFAELRHVRTRGYRLLKQVQAHGLSANVDDQDGSANIELNPPALPSDRKRPVASLPFRRIWTSNVLWTLLSVAIFDFHMGAFANLWILFLATPRQFTGQTNTNTSLLSVRDSLLKFSSGLAFTPPSIGAAMAIIGFIGVALQFLLYPWANARFGLMRCFRISLLLFPLAYALAPYIALLPSTSPPPLPAAGPTIWAAITTVLFLQVAARTFALPASIILVNNCCPHPSVLGTIHGLGNACSATFRTLGPIFAGYTFGVWTERGVVGMAWWLVALVAATGCVASYWVRNGTGHEILLPGEDEEGGAGGAP